MKSGNEVESLFSSNKLSQNFCEKQFSHSESNFQKVFKSSFSNISDYNFNSFPDPDSKHVLNSDTITYTFPVYFWYFGEQSLFRTPK